MIIDSHCHYNLSPLHDNWASFWKDAQGSGVVGSIVVGTSLESSDRAVELSSQTEGFFASVGIHPLDLTDTTSSETLKKLAQSQKVIAIGECGLDYFRLTEDDSLEKKKQLQKNNLIMQLNLAQELELPIIIHLRDQTDSAYWDFLELYRSCGAFSKPFILHCVSGPMQFVQECIELGAYIGVAGNITYKNAEHLRDLVRSVPRERVVIETDAPYLPPVPHRGETCQPSMIQLTEKYVVEHLGIPSSQLIENTIALFPEFKAIV